MNENHVTSATVTSTNGGGNSIEIKGDPITEMVLTIESMQADMEDWRSLRFYAVIKKKQLRKAISWKIEHLKKVISNALENNLISLTQ